MARGSSTHRWSRRGITALVVSLAAHGLALFFLAHARPARRPAPRDATVEVTVEERRAIPGPPPSRRKPSAAPAGQRVTAGGRGGGPGRRQKAASPSERRGPPPEPLAASGVPPPEPARGGGPGLLRMRGGSDLALDWRTFKEVEGTGSTGPGAPAAASSAGHGRGTDQIRSTAQRVAELLTPGGEENVRQGRVHPQFYDYLRDAQRAFHPTAAAVERDGGRPTVAGAFKGWWQGYLRSLDAHLGRAPDPRGVSPDQEGKIELTCDVCLTVRFGGEPHLEIDRRSSSEELDEAALAALRMAVDARPISEPLQPAGTTTAAMNGAVRACYRFSASARRLSPAALPSCAFDEVKLKASCTWPLEKIFRSEVKLLTVGPG